MRLFFFLLSLLIVSSLHAQLKMKLWPQGVPGSKSDSTYTEQILVNERGGQRISQVTDPELQVFAAPKEKVNGTAVVICPGGGYARLAIDHEGWDIAKWFNGMGISAFVLKYRLPSDKIMVDRKVGPLQDVQEAIRTVRRNATKWGVDPHKIGVMGFSAGGHLAGTASTMYNEKVYVSDTTSARPDFSILMYGVLSLDPAITHKGTQTNLLGEKPDPDQIRRFSNELNVNTNTPPTLLVHTEDDQTVPVENSIRYFVALKENGVQSELHVYNKGGHGYGLALNGGTVSRWPDACKKWLETLDLIK